MRQPLGQHFLRDPHVIQTILAAAELAPGTTALEIGPGKGILTDALAPKVAKLVAVELDKNLAELLQRRFQNNPHVTIIQADFLKLDLSALFPKTPRRHPPRSLAGDLSSSYAKIDSRPETAGNDELGNLLPIKILGNLPYAITSPILEKILAWPGWDISVFLLQREVAERMRSGPGSRTFGILSLAVQLFAEVESLLKVKPGAFSPPPQVTSSVVRLRRKPSPELPEETVPAFFDLAHGAFAHRRKTLGNSLAYHSGIAKKAVEIWLTKQGVNCGLRAETLGLEEYVRLSGKWAVFRRENGFDIPPGNVYNTRRFAD